MNPSFGLLCLLTLAKRHWKMYVRKKALLVLLLSLWAVPPYRGKPVLQATVQPCISIAILSFGDMDSYSHSSAMYRKLPPVFAMARAQHPVISSKHHLTNCGWLNKVGPHGPYATSFGRLPLGERYHSVNGANGASSFEPNASAFSRPTASAHTQHDPKTPRHLPSTNALISICLQ